MGGSVLPFEEHPVINLIPTSSDKPEIPDERKTKMERASRAKKDGNRVLVVGRQRELALLSYTLPSGEVQYLADAAHDYCSDCAVVVISNSSTVNQWVNADAVVMADEGPMALVSALKQVLDGT